MFLEPEDSIEDIETAVHEEVCAAWSESEIGNITWRMIKHATLADPTLQQLKKLLLSDSSSSDVRMLPDNVKPFSRHWNHLWIQDEVVLLHNRTVIPSALQNRVIDCLHSAHQGVSQMNARAELSVYWPGLINDLEKKRDTCKICHQIAPSNPKLPPFQQPDAEYPFQLICADYMTVQGVPYLVTVDRLTGWPDVRRARGSESGGPGLVKMLRDIFTTFGISEELTTDGGPEFMSHEVQKFLQLYGVRHRVSSVGNPHANQRAEVGVKSMKRLLQSNIGPSGSLDNDAFARAILQYRNTPLQSTGVSPAIALIGQPLKAFLPLNRANYLPRPQWMKKLSERETKIDRSRARESNK